MKHINTLISDVIKKSNYYSETVEMQRDENGKVELNSKRLFYVMKIENSVFEMITRFQAADR